MAGGKKTSLQIILKKGKSHSMFLLTPSCVPPVKVSQKTQCASNKPEMRLSVRSERQCDFSDRQTEKRSTAAVEGFVLGRVEHGTERSICWFD